MELCPPRRNAVVVIRELVPGAWLRPCLLILPLRYAAVLALIHPKSPTLFVLRAAICPFQLSVSPLLVACMLGCSLTARSPGAAFHRLRFQPRNEQSHHRLASLYAFQPFQCCTSWSSISLVMQRAVCFPTPQHKNAPAATIVPVTQHCVLAASGN